MCVRVHAFFIFVHVVHVGRHLRFLCFKAGTEKISLGRGRGFVHAQDDTRCEVQTNAREKSCKSMLLSIFREPLSLPPLPPPRSGTCGRQTRVVPPRLYRDARELGNTLNCGMRGSFGAQ